MVQVQLYTQGWEFVAVVEIPPFVKPPDVLIWGQRVFKYSHFYGYERYVEAFAFWVPV